MAPTVLKKPFWGTPTSTVDWCEANYEVTEYIAEFWNTISNVVIIFPSLVLAYVCRSHKLEKRLVLLFLFYSLVGVGSWWFHMTLLYEMQLLDELPMLVVCLLIISSLGSSLTHLGQSSPLFNFALLLIGIMTTVIYMVFKLPILFQGCYITLTCTMIALDFVALQRYPKVKIPLYVGLVSHLIGGLFWILDNSICNTLTRTREVIPRGLSPLTQFHALWHVFAGSGALCQIIVCTYSHLLMKYPEKDMHIRFGFSGLGFKANQLINNNTTWKDKDSLVERIPDIVSGFLKPRKSGKRPFSANDE